MQAHARMTPARPTHPTEGLLLLRMGRRRLLLRTGPTSAEFTHKNFFGETWIALKSAGPKLQNELERGQKPTAAQTI